MMESEAITITEELIEAGKSERGGWNRPQLALLGIDWPPVTGWKAQVVGKKITQRDAHHFVTLRGHLSVRAL